MWFLNYCAPFIYDAPGTYQTIRTIMYITLAIEFLVYIFYILMYKTFGQITHKVSNKKEEDCDEALTKGILTYPGFQSGSMRTDQKRFKEWYLHYFGLHSVAVGGCIMYSAYTVPLVFAIIHTICLVICAVLHSCSLRESIGTFYNVLVTILSVMDVLLLFATSMGVGAAGYDLNAKNCFLLE